MIQSQFCRYLVNLYCSRWQIKSAQERLSAIRLISLKKKLSTVKNHNLKCYLSRRLEKSVKSSRFKYLIQIIRIKMKQEVTRHNQTANRSQWASRIKSSRTMSLCERQNFTWCRSWISSRRILALLFIMNLTQLQPQQLSVTVLSSLWATSLTQRVPLLLCHTTVTQTYWVSSWALRPRPQLCQISWWPQYITRT